MLRKNKLRDVPLGVTVFSQLVTSLLAISMIFPVLLIISTSFTSQESIIEHGFTLFPSEISFDGYDYLFKNINQIGRAYGITLFVTIVGTMYGVIIMFFYAYVISRPNFPWKTQFSFYVFFTMLFSGGMLASYLVNTQYYHLQDTIWSMILPSGVSAMYIIMMRTYLQTSVPNEVIESARIDGANEFTCLFRIVMPMAVPVIATIALFTAVSYWNAWTPALLYIVKRDDLAPISLLIMRIEKNIEYLANNSQTLGIEAAQMKKDIPTDAFRMALVLVAIVPMLASYPFFQKYFMTGLTVGSVKG